MRGNLNSPKVESRTSTKRDMDVPNGGLVTDRVPRHLYTPYLLKTARKPERKEKGPCMKSEEK